LKITEVKTLVARGRDIKNWVFVKIMTDEGIYGVGDPALGNKALTSAACVQDMARLLVGQDPTRIQHLWQLLRRNSFSQGAVIDSAISGIEMALWDILGKSLGVPVYKLLGGAVRDRLRVYSSGFSHGARNLEELREKAIAAVENGYTALKITPVVPAVGNTLERTFWKAAVAKVRAVREAVGDEIDIAVDFHGRLIPHEAIQLIKMLEEYRPWFIEEPVLPDDVEALAQIQASTWIPIATGERLRTKHQFQELVARRACSILQPDPHCGGIMELRLIAAMAESRYMAVIPHQAGSPVNAMAALQVAACTPNVLAVEHFDSFASGKEGFLLQPIEVRAGYVDLPAESGLGIDLNEEVIRAHPYQPVDFPVWTREDGTLTNW
jgi:galactonate dehydratase